MKEKGKNAEEKGIRGTTWKEEEGEAEEKVEDQKEEEEKEDKKKNNRKKKQQQKIYAMDAEHSKASSPPCVRNKTWICLCKSLEQVLTVSYGRRERKKNKHRKQQKNKEENQNEYKEGKEEEEHSQFPSENWCSRSTS